MKRNELINKPRVAVAKGATRQEAVRNALELVREDIMVRVRGDVLIKPNFLSSTNPLASTQTDAVFPVIELLDSTGADSLCIAEGATRSTGNAYKNFGYEDLVRKFDNIELIDLNKDTYTGEFEIVTRNRGVQMIQFGDRPAAADTVISVALAKTHNFATVTASLKNMMGCLRRIHRPRMHGIKLGHVIEYAGESLWNILDEYPVGMKMVSGLVFGALHMSRYIQKKHNGVMSGYISQVRALSENLVRLGRVLMPDIAVIDAFDVMEGEGPGSGTAVRMGIAVAGTDPVACDAVMTYMMGFDPLSIGYLSLANDSGIGCADLMNIEIAGEDPSAHVRQIKPHSNYPLQMKWREAWQ